MERVGEGKQYTRERAAKASFQLRQENFLMQALDMPLSIAFANYATIMNEDPGITDWKEDVAYLENQLKWGQIGTCESFEIKTPRAGARLQETRWIK